MKICIFHLSESDRLCGRLGTVSVHEWLFECVQVFFWSGISAPAFISNWLIHSNNKRDWTLIALWSYAVCDWPSACPRSEGNPPKVEAHTSPGLHLGGLKGDREREEINKVKSVSSKTPLLLQLAVALAGCMILTAEVKPVQNLHFGADLCSCDC